jgi:hypothetical protein
MSMEHWRNDGVGWKLKYVFRYNVPSLLICSPHGLAWDWTRASKATGHDRASNSKSLKFRTSRRTAITSGTDLKRVPKKQQCDMVCRCAAMSFLVASHWSLVRSYLIWRRCRELETCWRLDTWITLLCLLSVCGFLNLLSLCQLLV